MEKVIVYRSKFEAEVDGFWWDVMTSYPRATLAVVVLLVVLFVGVLVVAARRRR